MQYEHEIVGIIHIILILPLYFLCRNIALFALVFFFMTQVFGIDLLIYSLLQGNYQQAVLAPMAIIIPLSSILHLKNLSISFNAKKYNGIKLYLLLLDTDLKYIVGLFLISLWVNLYFNPLPGLLNYTILTSVIALITSMFFCRRMNIKSIKNDDSIIK